MHLSACFFCAWTARVTDRSYLQPDRSRGFLLCVVFFLVSLSSAFNVRAGEVFIYSSQSFIRGLDLDKSTDRALTTSPFASGVNALAYNLVAGIVYYGDGTSVYRWNPADGSGPAAHVLMNDFSVGPVVEPITNINSTAGSYLEGKYYVGSESDTGFIEDLYELTMSTAGTQVVSARAMNLQAACNCTSVQLGGFGDVAALNEGGVTVLYGSSADISGRGLGTSAGRWRFTPSTNSFELLSPGVGGQMSGSVTGALYSNVGNDVREVNRTTGAISGTTIITTTAAIFDFTSGFELDFGDAPDSYGSAFHRLSSGSSAYIGSLAPDNEAGALNDLNNSINGLGDDDDGTDDEDAIDSVLSISSLSPTFSITIECSAGARVAAWIDRNIDGVFGVDERNANHPVTCSGGTADLVWSDMLTATTGDSYIRLRASTNAAAVSNATGVATDGEVEDHRVTITGSTASTGSCPAGSVSTVYTATDLRQRIGPNAGTTTVSTINVTDNVIITDVNVLEVSGTHRDINDLSFDLLHDGVTRRLFGRACGSQDNFHIGFDDSATGTPPCAPTDTNSYPPVEPLSGFNGQSALGDWQLRITDSVNRRGGWFNTWLLELCSAGPQTEVPDLTLGKQVSVTGSQVAIRMLVMNAGNVALNEVGLADNLDAVFGVGNYTVNDLPVLVAGPDGASINAAYNGSTQVQLLGSSINLAVGESLTVDVFVTVDTIADSATPGQYSNQSEATAISNSGTVVTDLSGSGLDVSIDTDIPTSFVLDASAYLSGHVFDDSSANASTSHDGLMQVGEDGVANRIVRALDNADQVLAVTSTNALGNWSLVLDAQQLNQEIRIVVQPDTSTRFVSESPAYSNAGAIDGSLLLVPGYADVLSDLDFGIVSQPILMQDNTISANPGDLVVLAHEWLASTHGIVNFSSSTNVSPAGGGWSGALYADMDCDGGLSASDALWQSALTVVKDETVCLLLVSNVPAGQVDASVLSSDIIATFSVSDDSGIGHNLTFSSRNRDVISLVNTGSGQLELVKSVSNVTLGGQTLTANSARPGHILEYRIAYTNIGDGPLSALTVEDAAPPFTQVQPASLSCDVTPSTLNCVPAISGNSLSWQFSGTLSAGQSGEVSYQVVID